MPLQLVLEPGGSWCNGGAGEFVYRYCIFKADPNCVKKGLNSYESGRLCSVTVLEDGVIVGKV